MVASNVKADRDSANRHALIEAKNNVSNATAGLVASAKSYLQIIDDQSKQIYFSLSFKDKLYLNMKFLRCSGF